MAHYDVVVCGLGVMGSAALHRLAQRGQRVLGIDKFSPGHDRGSSHGDTRIIRLGYFEHPSYVPLLRRAYDVWREIETAAGETLLHITGIAEIGPPDGKLVQGTLAASRLHGLPHEVLDAGALMRRHPAFRVPPDYLAVLQPDGGFLEAERSVHALVGLAKACGAEVRTDTTIRAVEPQGDSVRVVTEHSIIEAGAAIVAAGPWTQSLLPGLPLPLRVTRQAMVWFEPKDRALFERFPVFLIESRHGIHYGFPPIGGAGMKVAKHHHADETVDPDRHDRTVSAADEALIRPALAEHIPAANGVRVDARTCLYTMTPDHDFLIDRVPGAPQIVLASACSGHGFKFAPVVAEILADLASVGTTSHDIARFRLGRFP